MRKLSCGTATNKSAPNVRFGIEKGFFRDAGIEVEGLHQAIEMQRSLGANDRPLRATDLVAMDPRPSNPWCLEF